MIPLARLLILTGIILAVVGLVLYFLGRSGLKFTQLPGNIWIERGNISCVFALGASILISIILTLILNIVTRFLNR